MVTAAIAAPMTRTIPALRAPHIEERRQMLPASGFRTQRAGGIAEQTVPGEESVDRARWNGVNIWYYFNTLTGGPQGSLMKNATTPDGYKVGADGAWLQ